MSYPFKNFSRINKNMLANAKKKSTRQKDSKIQEVLNSRINKFQLIKTIGERSPVYQIIVQYERG